jgi:D-amino peptidase
MMEGVQLGFDAVFLVGYHAMAGTADGVIVHTYTGRIASVKLNGTPVGEIGISAALAGHYGAPVALVTGDDKAVREARELLGDVETVEVKKGLGAYAALCLTPAACNERIRQGAERALRKAPSLEPFRVETPVELAVGFTTASAVDRVAAIPGVKRVDGTTVAASAADALQAFRIFHLMTDLVELVPFI